MTRSVGDSVQVVRSGPFAGMTGVVHEAGAGCCNVRLDRYITRERFADADLVADLSPPARLTLGELAKAERAMAEERGMHIADAADLLRRRRQDELERKEGERGDR